MTIFAVSHELFIANPDHGLGTLTVRDGDYLIKSSDNEIRVVADADGVAAGHPVTGWSHHTSAGSPVGSWWGTAVVQMNLPITGYWRIRTTGVAGWDGEHTYTHGGAGTGVGGAYEFGYIHPFKGTHALPPWEKQVLTANNATGPLEAFTLRGEVWPKGPVTMGAYYSVLGAGALQPPPGLRIHLDRLDGRAIHKPEIYERRNNVWVQRPDQWPAPGSAFSQGSLANGHAYVYDGTTMKPMGTNCYIWTGTQWVTP